ncbi:MAG: GNAT family N-acetyltransferase [Myxococcota bacterium]
MTELPIAHAEADGRGAFFLERDGARIAEMTYVRSGPREVIVDHTEVHERLKGLGVGRKLLDRLVAWARETGTTVRATCPYARGQFEKDPSIRDVWADR